MKYIIMLLLEKFKAVVSKAFETQNFHVFFRFLMGLSYNAQSIS
jgi:myosin heavy subunit